MARQILSLYRTIGHWLPGCGSRYYHLQITELLRDLRFESHDLQRSSWQLSARVLCNFQFDSYAYACLDRYMCCPTVLSCSVRQFGMPNSLPSITRFFEIPVLNSLVPSLWRFTNIMRSPAEIPRGVLIETFRSRPERSENEGENDEAGTCVKYEIGD